MDARRVTLVGDALSCVSFLAGQGCALAMAAAYILASELHRARGDYAEAFRRYQNLSRHSFSANRRLRCVLREHLHQNRSSVCSFAIGSLIFSRSPGLHDLLLVAISPTTSRSRITESDFARLTVEKLSKTADGQVVGSRHTNRRAVRKLLDLGGRVGRQHLLSGDEFARFGADGGQVAHEDDATDEASDAADCDSRGAPIFAA